MNFSKKKLIILKIFIVSLQVIQCEKHKSANYFNPWNIEDDNYESNKNADEGVSFLDRIYCSSTSSEDCKDQPENFSFNARYKKQRHHSYSPDKEFSAIPMLRSKHSFPFCYCEHDQYTVDLGSLYYPRFLKTMNCKPKHCFGSYACRPKIYNINVLKKRKLEDSEPLYKNFPDFPEVLKDLFEPTNFTVAVACECSE